MAKPGEPKTGSPRAKKRVTMPRTKPYKPTSTEHVTNVMPANPAPQDEAFADARERWLADLAIEFKHCDGSTDLKDALRDYTRVGLREICAAILDHDLVSAVTSVIDKSFGEYLQKDYDDTVRDGGKWQASAMRPPFIAQLDTLSRAREALRSEFNLLAESGGWRPIAPYPSGTNWDIGFALRSMVIPAPSGVLTVLGQPDPQACWREYTRLEHERNQTQLRDTRIDEGLRARLEASNQLEAEMPHSFKESVTVLHSQFWTLFRGLMRGLLSSDGVHPVTRKYRLLDARIWARANIALDIRTGDLINTRTGEVEWGDVCISSQTTQKPLVVYPVDDREPRSNSGRNLDSEWLEALDLLFSHPDKTKRLDLEKLPENATKLAAMLLMAHEEKNKTGKKDIQSAQNWIFYNLRPIQEIIVRRAKKK